MCIVKKKENVDRNVAVMTLALDFSYFDLRFIGFV